MTVPWQTLAIPRRIFFDLNHYTFASFATFAVRLSSSLAAFAVRLFAFPCVLRDLRGKAFLA